MKVELDPKIGSDPTLNSMVEAATQVVVETLDSSPTLAKVEWGLGDQSGRPVVKLKLIDSFGSQAELSLQVSDLKKPNLLGSNFNRLWGDVLQNRSRKQLQQLAGVIDAPLVK